MSNVLKSMRDVSAYQAGGQFDCSTQAACNANFPGLKHFFPCTEAIGAATIADRAGSLVLGPSPSAPTVTDRVDGLITFGAADLLSGAFSVPATKKVVILAVGAPTSATAILSMGPAGNVTTTTNEFIRLGASSGAPTKGRVGLSGVAALDTDVTSLLVPNSTLRGWGMYVDWAGNQQQFYVDDADAVTSSAASALTGMAAGLDAFTAQSTTDVISSGFIAGNIQVFHFTALPSLATLQGALAFMRAMLALGEDNKFVYPGLFGLA